MRTTKFLVFSLVCGFLLLTGCGTQVSVEHGSTPQKVSESETMETMVTKKSFTFSQKVPVDNFADRIGEFQTELAQANAHRGGSFAISIFPFGNGMLLLGNLGEYYTKRYDDGRIRSEFLKINSQLGGRTAFVVGLAHEGGYDNEDELLLDENTYEFFFLENEEGDFVRATSQELGTFDNKVDRFSDVVSLVLYFPEDQIDELMLDSEELYMTFDGLNILSDDRIRLRYPFNEYYKDVFPEIDVMLEEM